MVAVHSRVVFKWLSGLQKSGVHRGLCGLEGRVGQRLEDRQVRGSVLLPVAKYLFSLGGKSVRPRVATAMAGAANFQGGGCSSQLNWRQERVVEMVEMYHTSSLYHDDVIDAASTRRGRPSASSAWSPRHAVMGGDFVLTSAYSLLGQIDCQEVTESMSQTLADLVAGELLQMAGGLDSSEEGVELYTHKCYLKTGTLFAHSCRSVALLSPSPHLAEQAETYGRELGIAFQVVDDILDYVSSSEELGKPGAGADLGAGLRTAPLLLAARNCSDLARLLDLGEEVGSPEEVVKMVVEAGGVEEAAEMAAVHANVALEALGGWEGEQVEELRDLVGQVLGQVNARSSQGSLAKMA